MSNPLESSNTLDLLTASFAESELFQRLLSLTGGVLVGLPTPALAWVVTLLARHGDRPVGVVLPRESDVLALQQAAELFGGAALALPAPSLTPYQPTDLSLAVRAEESVALAALASGEARLLAVTPRALFRLYPPAEIVASRALRLEEGQEFSPADLTHWLEISGYRSADLVGELGQYASRGGVFDLFPPGRDLPIRLDFFGDTIDSLRSFDPQDQRSLDSEAALDVLPLSLYPTGWAAAEELAIAVRRELGPELTFAATAQLENLGEGIGFAGWEHLLPLNAAATCSLSELHPGALWIVQHPDLVRRELEEHDRRLTLDYRARLEQGELALPPERLERRLEETLEFTAAADFEVTEWDAKSDGESDGPSERGTIDFETRLSDTFQTQLPRFPREYEAVALRGERIVIVAPHEHWSRFEELCKSYDLPMGAGGVELVDGELTRGFRLPAIGTVLYGENQFFRRLQARPKNRNRFGPFLSGLRDLRAGEFVVHSDHGIAQFLGLRTVGSFDGADGPDVEVMELEYSNGRTLLLPLSRLDLIQKYSGIEGSQPRLDKLGGSSWVKKKQRVKSGMRELAGDLLKLYAERELSKAPALDPDSDLQAQFEDAFEFDPTEDQVVASQAIKEDLESERPMDRLLCGDVGFGKTEVALRAAFKLVDNGFQVAVLAPTTILADQHLDTFRRRFAGFPVTVELLSRLRTPAEVKEIKERLKDGKIDILVGTHRILSKDVKFPRLGLLVVDEEQRFGVAQKERLKNLKREVHVLALSATPVPRTLQLSLAGVRDLSVIETPPRDRMAVETAVVPYSREVVHEAIDFELERGGQVFYVFNRVQGIEEVASKLREIYPGIRLTVGHGQLDERELSHRMHAFKRGEYDLLLATTIIENGIDIPRVNTMIIHRAEAFGLAQLYQLRGRVGRSNLLGYCYLTIEPDRILTQTARERLTALKEFSDLGAGFRVAARDLEIRGAGNLLGAEQSGHIAAVGIETYLKMLEDTVRELRGETVEEAPSVALNLPIALAIPEGYIQDANLRMEMYRKIATGDDSEQELLAELEDRFGAPPDAVRQLVAAGSLKHLAESLRVQSIALSGRKLQVHLRRDARVDLDRLIEWVSREESSTFSPSGVLTVVDVDADRVLARARELLEAIAPGAPTADPSTAPEGATA